MKYSLLVGHTLAFVLLLLPPGVCTCTSHAAASEEAIGATAPNSCCRHERHEGQKQRHNAPCRSKHGPTCRCLDSMAAPQAAATAEAPAASFLLNAPSLVAPPLLCRAMPLAVQSRAGPPGDLYLLCGRLLI